MGTLKDALSYGGFVNTNFIAEITLTDAVVNGCFVNKVPVKKFNVVTTC